MEGEESTKVDANEKVLNNFFSKIVKNLDIPQYNQVDPSCQNIKDPVIKGIIKYKEGCTNSKFSFSFIEKQWYFKRNLKSSNK